MVTRKKFKLSASARLSGGEPEKLLVRVPKRAAKQVKKALEAQADEGEAEADRDGHCR